LDLTNKGYAREIGSELPHQYRVRITEGRIIGVITANHDNGISHTELACIIKINRKNLTRYTKRLIRKGLVVRGLGKRGKYYPATRHYRATSMTADIFGKAAAHRILNMEFAINSPFFKKEVNMLDELETALFKFSNKIGGIVTYMLIQSMNPSNKIVNNSRNGEECDMNIQRWVDDWISSLGPVLLSALKEHAAYLLRSIDDNTVYNDDGSIDFEKGTLNMINYLYKLPLYNANEKIILEFMSAFSNVYPNMTNILEKIRSYLPIVIDKEINHLEYEANRIKQQKLCKHDYELLQDNKYDNNIKHCPKCHKTKWITSPSLLTYK
jgi:hypothetical protein